MRPPRERLYAPFLAPRGSSYSYLRFCPFMVRWRSRSSLRQLTSLSAGEGPAKLINNNRRCGRLVRILYSFMADLFFTPALFRCGARAIIG